LRVVFPSLTVDEFMEVVTGLIGRRLGHVPEGVVPAAKRFAVDRGLTPRSARQFADMCDIDGAFTPAP
jgi:predicted AAA+ superfamily ATPase